MNAIFPTCNYEDMQVRGLVSLILHAHLPYVRHPNLTRTLEERWFFEAMMETYLPLLHTFRRLDQEHVPFRLTMTLTPTLLSMMNDTQMQLRFEAYLQRSIRLAKSEVSRLNGNPDFQNIASMYVNRWINWKELHENYDGNIINGYRHYVQTGQLECITSAATHAFLPFIKHPSLIYAQIEVGMREHERLLGKRPEGIWLPECAYSPELSPLLHACGVRYFIVDYHGFVHAVPQPKAMQYAPVRTPDGVFAFARDPDCSRQVWSTYEGYPGNYDYREYYRDIGFDLGRENKEEWEYIRPHLLDNGARINTGLKYYRITGVADRTKEPYRPERALERVKEHARHFLDSREQQLRCVNTSGHRPPITVCPYDAELFGHWWFEGPQWLEALFREQVDRWDRNEHAIQFVSPNDYLRLYPEQESANLSFSTWGRNGYADVWLQEQNDWIYPLLHEVEDRIMQAADRLGKDTNTDFITIQERILNRAITEWMLAASSDWAFIVDANTVAQYAKNRTNFHLQRVHKLLDMLDLSLYDQALVAQMEREYPCFTTVDYRLLLSIVTRHGTCKRKKEPFYPAQIQVHSFATSYPSREHHSKPCTIKRILMLTWEFPPLVVGGLSRAVYDLSRHLTQQHCEIVVVTREAPNAPTYEQMDGIHVYRAPLIHGNKPLEFMDWVFHMNASMSNLVDNLVKSGLTFDLIHAHDWLVYSTAAELNQAYHWPLIVTIHATEHGRNHGRLSSELSRRIHEMETRLTAEADHTIVCSHAMVQEVVSLFDLAHKPVTMIPNGIDAITNKASCTQVDASSTHLKLNDRPLLFYIGRLVYEKGVHILIEAMPFILQSVPHAKLIIAGTGPMRKELEAQVAYLGIQEHIYFAGFVQDNVRDAWIAASSVCVFPSLYEPFGIVALEAIRLGTPVVVSDTGGLAEIIDHGVNGYKFLPKHVKSLAWHVTDLLVHPEQTTRMAARAQQKIRSHYNWKKIAMSTRQVYEGVIAR